MLEYKGFDATFSLQGKVAIITGGAAGIGQAITQLYQQKGARVIVLDQQIGSVIEGPEIMAIVCDVSDKQSVEQAVAQAVTCFGQVDILVNSAGVVRLEPAEQVTEAAWDITLDVNLKGTFLMSQAVGHHFLTQKHGKIINLASQAALVALPHHLAYCASKAGVIGLTKVLALEWGPVGIQVNAISPTVVLTELGRKAWSGVVAEQMQAKIPAGRFAYPEEIAGCALFLASEVADMINGANLVIDGGYTIQ